MVSDNLQLHNEQLISHEHLLKKAAAAGVAYRFDHAELAQRHHR